jgi:hypothetical protein
MTEQAGNARENIAIRNELEQFIEASGGNVSEHMARINSQMDLYFAHGQWACTNDLPDKAIRSFMVCAKLVPNAPIIYSALSRVHLTRGDFARADKHARRALELQPGDLKSLLICRLIALMIARDQQFVDRLSLSIRTRIAGAVQALGSGAVAWPWGRDASAAWHVETIRNAAIAYAAHKYAVLRDVLPDGWPALLKAEQDAMLACGAMSLEASMNRYVTVDAPMAAVANYELAALVTKLSGQRVIPTYTFAIHYLPNGNIRPHTDRPQNELSMSLSLAFTPAGPDVSVLRAGPPGSIVRIDLAPNDALVYRGAEVTHARDPVPAGHTVNQAIFGFRTIDKSHCYCI